MDSTGEENEMVISYRGRERTDEIQTCSNNNAIENVQGTKVH
jgi:hypothetical protein